MDYPKSVPSSGLVNGRFVDENPLTGTPGSLIPAVWGNSVTEELLTVIRAAGMEPSESESDQLLRALRNVLTQDAMPLSALAFPTVATADGRIAVTAAGASAGGTVSVPGGVLVSLCEEVSAGTTARPRTLLTNAWNSTALDINSTYFLRMQVRGGALVCYVQKGTDADAVPAAMKGGTGASGGGFDSTCIDMLMAKVVTEGAGTVPKLTLLANKARLEAVGVWSGANGNYSMPLNWARKPRAYVAGICDFDDNVKTDYGVISEPIGVNITGKQIMPEGGFTDRYMGRVAIIAWAQNLSASGLMNARVRWEV
ncbi:phage tail protein [Pseudomonas ekonensis]|uniref:phage tail protein n=1 Tax=Pseudomonas ekonensis TaxID=2842353 RepID=UPI001CEC5B89|nr:phage tail protein [Pseudomonas ekonensis]